MAWVGIRLPGTPSGPAAVRRGCRASASGPNWKVESHQPRKDGAGGHHGGAAEAPTGPAQPKIFALPAWNSSSVMAPEAFRSASLATSSAVLEVAAACCT